MSRKTALEELVLSASPGVIHEVASEELKKLLEMEKSYNDMADHLWRAQDIAQQAHRIAVRWRAIEPFIEEMKKMRSCMGPVSNMVEKLVWEMLDEIRAIEEREGSNEQV